MYVSPLKSLIKWAWLKYSLSYVMLVRFSDFLFRSIFSAVYSRITLLNCFELTPIRFLIFRSNCIRFDTSSFRIVLIEALPFVTKRVPIVVFTILSIVVFSFNLSKRKFSIISIRLL